MRKIFLFMMVSIDGFYEGPAHDLSWHNVDEEFNEFAIAQLKNVGTILFGKNTYEMMASYWPGAEAQKDDPIVAGLMNSIPKIVFSTTLEHTAWQNTLLVKEASPDGIKKLKQQPGNDIAIFGSNNLCVSLMGMGLVDEFRIMVNPVVLGQGSALFGGIGKMFNFTLVASKEFNSGNVLLQYRQ